MEELRKQLENVKSGIEEHGDLQESETAKELLEVITPALENPGELSFKHHRILAEKMKKAVEVFEATHPRLFDEIRLIIQSLNESGI